ncbi:hypothetical protein WME94_23770 [Sorangium sp. So ce429]
MRFALSRSFSAAGALVLLASTTIGLGACVADQAPHDSAINEDTATTFTGFEEFEANVCQEPGTGVYIVDGDTPLATREQLEDFFSRHVQDGTLIVNRASGADDRWSDAQKRSLTDRVSTSFGANYASVVSAMASATAAWMATVVRTCAAAHRVESTARGEPLWRASRDLHRRRSGAGLGNRLLLSGCRVSHGNDDVSGARGCRQPPG